MRVTNRVLTNSLINNLRRNAENLYKIQGQIASGKKFTRPSENPAAVSQVLKLSAEGLQNEQYLRNLEGATAWLGVTETALRDLIAVAQRARELGVQCSNDTLSADDRRSAAREVSALLEHGVQVANAKYADHYVFAGFQTGTVPFTLSGGPPPDTVTYHGDDGEIKRSLGPDQDLTINTLAQGEFRAFFGSLMSLRDALSAGASPEHLLADLEQGLNMLVELTTEVGARMNRIQLTENRLYELKLNLTELRSRVEDLEMDEAAVELMAQQNVYHAALAAGARVIQPSLLDYLR